MNRVRRALLTLLALLLVGCTTTVRTAPKLATTPTPTAAPTLAPPPPANWTPCGIFQCATLMVPLDYAHPTGTKIRIALIRELAKDPAHRIGSLVINPGGPGGSGIEFLHAASGLFSVLNKRFDIVSFDPRGVGASTPIRCLTSAQMDQYIAINPAPITPTEIDQAITASQRFVAGCETKSTAILSHVGTVDSARDMDQIRAAIGDPKLTYLGFSYGTLLGATYADLFPRHVRALVLDGALDPALSNDEMSRSQALGFENNLQAFVGNCAARPSCSFYSGGHPGTELDHVLAKVSAQPELVGARTLGIGEAYLGVLSGLYSPDSWPMLASALHDADAGNGGQLMSLADSYDGRTVDGTYSNELESNTAINCDDGPSPTDLSHLTQLGKQLALVSPHFGVASAYGPLTCLYWPTPPTGRRALSATGAPPILVIGGTNDPATPYSWAQGLAHELHGAVLLTRTGDGHVSYDKSSCIRALANAYLLNPAAVPPANTTCPSD